MSGAQSTRNVSLTFEVDDRAPSLVRGFVADFLGEDPRRDAALVAVSELVTNVIRHAPASDHATAQVQLSDGALRIGVRQRGRPFTRPSEVTSGPSGRGLTIVEQLADDWGVATEDDMLEVWFTMMDC